MEFTKEQLQQIEAAAKEVLWPVVWSEKKAREHFSEKITPKVVLKLARIALASLEAEDKLSNFVSSQVSLGDEFEKVLAENLHELYVGCDTAPPAPVPVPVPDRSMFEKWWESEHGSPLDSWDSLRTTDGYCDDGIDGQFEAWNACRAAMLQGAEPVTTANKLPASTPCKDAPEHIWLQTSGVWTENAEFSELTWCSDNQHPDDTLYVRADVVAGNSPLIPDGWKLVPVEPTTNQWAAGMQAFDSGMDKVTRVYKAMLAAAPQQEVK